MGRTLQQLSEVNVGYCHFCPRFMVVLTEVTSFNKEKQLLRNFTGPMVVIRINLNRIPKDFVFSYSAV